MGVFGGFWQYRIEGLNRRVDKRLPLIMCSSFPPLSLIFHFHVARMGNFWLAADDDAQSSSSLTSSLLSTHSLSHQLSNLSIPDMESTHPTCFPPVYDSATGNPGLRDKRLFYNVYAGDQCGCFRDWSVSISLREVF